MSTSYMTARAALIRKGLQPETADRVLHGLSNNPDLIEQLVIEFDQDQATEDAVNSELAQYHEALFSMRHVYDIGQVAGEGSALAKARKALDDRPAPSVVRQMKVMKTALERIDKTNGSTGGSDALVRELKTTASMALGLVADLQAGRMV